MVDVNVVMQALLPLDGHACDPDLTTDQQYLHWFQANYVRSDKRNIPLVLQLDCYLTAQLNSNFSWFLASNSGPRTLGPSRELI